MVRFITMKEKFSLVLAFFVVVDFQMMIIGLGKALLTRSEDCLNSTHDYHFEWMISVLKSVLLLFAECDSKHPCQGLGEHAHFANFGMAFLTLFRVATGDNWNGIMKDTIRKNCDPKPECIKNCCINGIIAPIFFVIFVLMAQFVLVNVVVAVLMKHLEESHKQVGGRQWNT